MRTSCGLEDAWIECNHAATSNDNHNLDSGIAQVSQRLGQDIAVCKCYPVHGITHAVCRSFAAHPGYEFQAVAAGERFGGHPKRTFLSGPGIQISTAETFSSESGTTPTMIKSWEHRQLRELQTDRTALQARPATLQVRPAPLQVRPATLQVRPATLQVRQATLQVCQATLQVGPATLQVRQATLQARQATLQAIREQY
jgi:hypothetical protein